MGKSVLMGRGHSRFQGKGNFKISFEGNLACPMAEKVIWHVSMEIRHQEKDILSWKKKDI